MFACLQLSSDLLTFTSFAGVISVKNIYLMYATVLLCESEQLMRDGGTACCPCLRLTCAIAMFHGL